MYGEPIFIQMCVKAKTDRVHHVGPYPHALSVTHSESGWASAIGTPWMVWDSAPVHHGAETVSKAQEEHTKGSLFENNGPGLDNATDEDPEGVDLHEDEVQDGCTRAWDVKEAEEEEALAEP